MAARRGASASKPGLQNDLGSAVAFQDPGVLFLVVVGDVGGGDDDAGHARGLDLVEGGRAGPGYDQVRRRHELGHVVDVFPHFQIGMGLQIHALLLHVVGHPPPAVGAGGVDVMPGGAVFALDGHEAGDDLVHFPGSEAAPGGQDQRALVQTEGLSGLVVPGVEELLPHGHAHDLDPVRVFIEIPALLEADHDPVRAVGGHAGGEARHGVGLVHGGGDAPLCPLPQHGVGGVAAGADDHIGLEVPDDRVGLSERAAQIVNVFQVVPDGPGGQLPLVAGDLQGLQREALPGDQLFLHALHSADEEDLSLRPAGLQELCNGDCGVDVAAGAAAGKDDVHAFARLLFQDSLLTDHREMLSMMPISNSCSSRAVPP